MNEKNKNTVKIAATVIPLKRIFTNNNNIKKTKLKRKLNSKNIKKGMLIKTADFTMLPLTAPKINVSGKIKINPKISCPSWKFSLLKTLLFTSTFKTL